MEGTSPTRDSCKTPLPSRDFTVSGGRSSERQPICRLKAWFGSYGAFGISMNSHLTRERFCFRDPSPNAF